MNQSVSQLGFARRASFSAGTWSRELDSVVDGIAVSVGPDLPGDPPREGCVHHGAVLAHHVHSPVLPPSSEEEEQGGLARGGAPYQLETLLLPIFSCLFLFLRASQALPSPSSPAQDLGTLYPPQPWESQPLILFAGWLEQILAHCAAAARKKKRKKNRRWKTTS